MGTNFYLEPKPWVFWRRSEKPLHIGKSSAGWTFGLHIYPEDPDLPQNLDDWKRRFRDWRYLIRDEYDRRVSPDAMFSNIVDRGTDSDFCRHFPDSSQEERYRKNFAMPGPRGLMRRQIDLPHCVGHGEGTWDLLAGDFS